MRSFRCLSIALPAVRAGLILSRDAPAITPAALAAKPDDLPSLKAAAAAVVNKLVAYSTPAQSAGWLANLASSMPPWESSLMWSTVMDYQNYTGDAAHAAIVAGALTALSSGDADFKTLPGQVMNSDDVAWSAQAAQIAEELGVYKPTKADPIDVTLNEMWQPGMVDSQCTKPPYALAFWYFDRSKSTYKSLITNVLYLSLAARRAVFQPDPSRKLALLQNILNLTAGIQEAGLVPVAPADPAANANALLFVDGVGADPAGKCPDIFGLPNTREKRMSFSYHHGELLGALHFLIKLAADRPDIVKTAKQSANLYVQMALKQFAPHQDNVGNVLQETCGDTGTKEPCQGPDQPVFKASLLRNLAYVYPDVEVDQQKAIKGMIHDSIVAMVGKNRPSGSSLCSDAWDCSSLWLSDSAPPTSVSPTAPDGPTVQKQLVAAALLVAAVGVLRQSA